jgi:hypothetical protein
MDQKQREVRKLLYEDFKVYSKYALKVRTKDGEIKPFVLNEAQSILLSKIEEQLKTEGKIRIIILKARQMGMSTFVGGFLYSRVSQRRAKKALVITHLAESTKSLFDLTKRYHDLCPEILKPQTRYSSRKELVFNVLDSAYSVATAGGDGIARGETITDAHLSELAFWPTATARDNLNAILQAIPNAKDSCIIVESTANGLSGPFYDLWRGAVEGTNGFVPVFLPWNIQSEYREPVPANFKRTPEEEELVEKHGLDDEQLMFRRKKIAASGRELFVQEYPLTAEEAFITSGRPIFNLEQLQRMLDKAPDIIERLALENDEWVPHARGELLVYRQHDPGENYVIGADIAMGVRGGDWSVAQVLDGQKRQVATFRAHVHPDWFATVLYRLGEYYNMAKIIPENNNHGILTCTRLAKDMAYPNVYFTTEVDKLTERETIKIGFSTNAKTKPLIIDQLRAALRENEMELNDKTTIRELTTYIATETGGMEAEQGCFDDCVVSLALANHAHEGRFTPIPVTDDFYVDAI